MTDRSRIKVIKKDEASPTTSQKSDKPAPAAAAREMVSTVSEWVTDLKTRKRHETKLAIDRLFSQTPRPSES
jgi:hypothetical protein